MSKLIYYTNHFTRDMKKVSKQYKDLSSLKNVIDRLLKGLMLPPKFRDHKLLGKYKGSRECHIFPDLLLVYDTSDPNELVLQRLGSHSELF
jgi:mRNA interferase YafQ